MDVLARIKDITKLPSMNQRWSTLLLVCLCSGLSSAYGQIEKSTGIKGGVNLFRPTFVYFNTESFESTMPGFQLWIFRDFSLQKDFGINVSLGYNFNSFNAKRDVGSLLSIKQIDFGYISVEAGPIYRLKIGTTVVWGGLGLRGGRLIYENYSDYYTIPSLSRLDLGVNAKMGVQLASAALRPFIEVGYYYGLQRVAENFVISGSGQSLNDYIRNRSFSLQVGLYFPNQ
jgi:hypothetical protein